MEEQRVADDESLRPLVDDLGERDSGLPLAVRVRHGRQRMAVDERELAALEQHAAIGDGEAPPLSARLAITLPTASWPASGSPLDSK